jgi:cytochrome b pre-mRNA-processing protein 3
MFGLWRRDNGRGVVDALHHRIVEQSREPALYEAGGLPDTVEGRFESLDLHVLLVLRRLRALPAPADEVAQELVDRVFAHFDISLRELGVGDSGVSRRIKKLASAFYNRLRRYDPLLDAGEPAALAAEIATHVEVAPGRVMPLARYALASEGTLAACDLDAILNAPRFARVTSPEGEEVGP